MDTQAKRADHLRHAGIGLVIAVLALLIAAVASDATMSKGWKAAFVVAGIGAAITAWREWRQARPK